MQPVSPNVSNGAKNGSGLRHKLINNFKNLSAML
jgi:hypothetical protein